MIRIIIQVIHLKRLNGFIRTVRRRKTRESGGEGKIFLCLFSQQLRGQTLQRGLKYTPIAMFVLCFLEIDEGVIQPLTINLIHSPLKDYALMEMHTTLDYG